MSFSTAPQFRDSAGGKTVDPRLLDILQTAAQSFGLNVQATSGVAARSTGTQNHPGGYAVDIQLVDPSTGKVLPNYQNAQSFAAYQQFANAARSVQESKYPELGNTFRWGGYFAGGPNPMDLMHFDVNPTMNGAMGGGTWANGPTAAFRERWGIPQGTALSAIAQAAPTPFPAPAGTDSTLAFASKPNTDMASLYGPAPSPLRAPDVPSAHPVQLWADGTKPTAAQIADMYGNTMPPAPLVPPSAPVPYSFNNGPPPANDTSLADARAETIARRTYVPPPVPQTTYVAPDGSVHYPPQAGSVQLPLGVRPNVPALPSATPVYPGDVSQGGSSRATYPGDLSRGGYSMPPLGTVNIPPNPNYPLIQTVHSSASPPYSSINPPNLTPAANSSGAKANGSDGWPASMPPLPIPRPTPPPVAAPVPLPAPAWQSPVVSRAAYPGDLSGGGLPAPVAPPIPHPYPLARPSAPSASVYPGDVSMGGVPMPPLNLGIPPPHIPSPVGVLPIPAAIPTSIGAVPPVPFGNPPWLAPMMPQSSVIIPNIVTQAIGATKPGLLDAARFLSGGSNNYSYLAPAAARAGVAPSTLHAALMAQQNRSQGGPVGSPSNFNSSYFESAI